MYKHKHIQREKHRHIQRDNLRPPVVKEMCHDRGPEKGIFGKGEYRLQAGIHHI